MSIQSLTVVSQARSRVGLYPRPWSQVVGSCPDMFSCELNFMVHMKKFNEFSFFIKRKKKKKKKKSLHTNLSCIKTKAAIKFPKKKKKKKKKKKILPKIGLALEGLHATIKMYLTSDTQYDYYTLITT